MFLPSEHLFIYESGSFKSGDPIGIKGKFAEGVDIGVILQDAGFRPSQLVGNNTGLHYELYDGEGEGFAVLFGTATDCCLIYAASWPDLILLLKDLSPIALAGMTSDTDARGNTCAAHFPVRLVKKMRRYRN